MREGRLFVISGPSGAGKSTVLKRILANHPDFFFSISATTRPPRPAEVPGKSYHFISMEQFEAMIAADSLLEHNLYAGNYYGTPAEPLLEVLHRGGSVLLDVDPHGAFQVQRRRSDAVLIFLAPPSVAELGRRLHARGDTPPEKIQARLEQARWEYQQAEKYTYIVINDQVDRCVREIEAILAQDPSADRYLYQNRKDALKEEH